MTWPATSSPVNGRFLVRFLSRTVATDKALPESSAVPPAVPPSQEQVAEAVDEQERREKNHSLPYRDDQRVQAIQQRLSRSVGAKAFEGATRAVILEELGRREK